MKFDVIGMGALNVDKLYIVNHIAKEDGESSILDSFETCGGSAANTMVGLTRLGLKTGYVGKVAWDREGRLLLKDFEKEKVDTEGIVVAKTGRSGVVIGFVDKEGERALYIDAGVNSALGFDEINLQYAHNASFIHITSFVGEKAFQVQKKLRTLISNNVKISLDPGELYAKKGLTVLKPIIKRCFDIFPNEHELELLTGEDHKEGVERYLTKAQRLSQLNLVRKDAT